MLAARRKPLAWACALVLGLSGAAGAAAAEEGDYTSSAEIRIGLPPGDDARVEIRPAGQRIIVELPAGAVFPQDFAESSGGLLRGGRVSDAADGRMQLEVDLALGVLDRVVFEPGTLVLQVHSRYEVPSTMLAPGVAARGQYTIGPDDVLVVTVHGHPELTAKLGVNREGFITAPLVGDVEAAGLTPRELSARLAELFGRDYLVNPQVDAEVETYSSQWVMVAGHIRIPGRVPLRGGTTLKQVLSEAGGFTETAGEEITITRKTGDGEGNEAVRLDVDRRAFERGETNPTLAHGDIVTVSEAKYAYLQGEVGIPSRVRIDRELTLMKAIAQAGGLTDWANRRKVQILANGEQKARTINIKDIQNGKIPDPVLVGGEIIVVTRRFF